MFYLADKHSQLRIGSVIDDRKGPTDVVLAAAADAVQFDSLAGLRNNVAKYVAVGNSVQSHMKLAACKLGEGYLSVKCDCNLLGVLVTARKAPRRWLQNSRVSKTIQAARVTANLPVTNELSAYGTMSAAIPKILYGNLWVMPSTSILGKLVSIANGFMPFVQFQGQI